MTTKKYRIEKDSIGEIKVANDKLWGAQTQRSFENFKIGNQKMPIEIIKSIALVKKACAQANLHFKKLNANYANAITNATNGIINNKFDKQFPLVVWQTGSGTQTNMNVNEVIAHIASKKFKNIHPNDHVNMSQSSNDVFPTAMHLAFTMSITTKLIPILRIAINSFTNLEKQTKDIIKIGRTHLQDATPITFGQEVSAWKHALIVNQEMILASLIHLRVLAIGGTAVGTGINAPKNFDKEVVKHLNQYTKFEFLTSSNKFHALSFKDAILNAHGAIQTLATSLFKIANDIRWLASGPRSGIGEITIPANEPGSSIMPGKVNPTQCESMMMVCSQVIGNHSTITFATSQGNFQLNVMMPVITYNFLNSINLLGDALDSFIKKCVNGIKVNKDKIQFNLHNSLMLVTTLSPKIGYAKAADIAKYAYKNNLTLKQATLELKYVTAKEFDELVDPKKMI